MRADKQRRQMGRLSLLEVKTLAGWIMGNFRCYTKNNMNILFIYILRIRLSLDKEKEAWEIWLSK